MKTHRHRHVSQKLRSPPFAYKGTVRPVRSFRGIQNVDFSGFKKAGGVRLDAGAASAKLAVVAGPAEVGIEAFAFDRLKDLLNPSNETPVILRGFIGIDLLEPGGLRLDQDVVAD